MHHLKDRKTFLNTDLAGAILATIHHLEHTKADIRRQARKANAHGASLTQVLQ